jgi:cytochrome c-type biogenesis protein
MVNQILEGFTFGSASILTTACLLPLYPGMIAFLAGTADDPRARRGTAILGVLVLAGVLSMMVLIGFLLHLLSRSSNDILPYVLPLVYGLVIVFGGMMLAGRSPFAKLQTVQAPLLRNPYLTAYVYGLLFGPMTIPCTGPIILSAFAIGAVDSSLLVDQLLYFLGVGLGFGWPLVLLPLLAMPVQRRLIGVLTANHTLLERGAGVLLIGVGIFGILTELLPQIDPANAPELSSNAQYAYWLAVALVVVAVGVVTRAQGRNSREMVAERELLSETENA